LTSLARQDLERALLTFAGDQRRPIALPSRQATAPAQMGLEPLTPVSAVLLAQAAFALGIRWAH
jgi:hypothetical protein